MKNEHMNRKALTIVEADLSADSDSSIKRAGEIQATHYHVQTLRASIVTLNKHLRESGTFNGDPMLRELWQAQMEPIYRDLVEIDGFVRWAMDSVKPAEQRIKTPSEVEVY